MNLTEGIKNIIFDFGGVVINLDIKLSIDEFKKLGIPDFEKFYTQHRQELWFHKFDRGRINGDQFVKEIKKHLPCTITDKQIIDAWNKMLLDFPATHAELLRKIKTRYRTFLLSNTNDLHIDYYSGLLEKWYGIKDMSSFFEKEYYSYRIGRRKPDPETFQFVLEENQLKPEETLFIDDTLQHVEGARKCGIRAYHLQWPETIMDLFNGEK
jgi:putative hydrolase of the HAD superfamily